MKRSTFLKSAELLKWARYGAHYANTQKGGNLLPAWRHSFLTKELQHISHKEAAISLSKGYKSILPNGDVRLYRISEPQGDNFFERLFFLGGKYVTHELYFGP